MISVARVCRRRRRQRPTTMPMTVCAIHDAWLVMMMVPPLPTRQLLPRHCHIQQQQRRCYSHQNGPQKKPPQPTDVPRSASKSTTRHHTPQPPHHGPAPSPTPAAAAHNHEKRPPPSIAAAASSVASNMSTTTATRMQMAYTVAIGLTAGLVNSLAGMGGGLLMIPALTSSGAAMLQLPQHVAHGTSLVAVTATGVAGAWSYRNYVDVPAALGIAVSGLVTAPWGARVARQLSAHQLQRALGVLMLCLVPALPFKQYLLERHDAAHQEIDGAAVATAAVAPPTTTSSSTLATTTTTETTTPSQLLSTWNATRVLAPLAIGATSGFIAGMFGIGGGIIAVPGLVLTLDLAHHVALATSLTSMIVPAVRGTVAYATRHLVAWHVAPALVGGALVGGYVGGQVGGHMSERTLQYGLSGLLVILGARTLVRP